MILTVADDLFDSWIELSVATAWLGAAAYTLQIYFYFSGYSDMAIGLGAKGVTNIIFWECLRGICSVIAIRYAPVRPCVAKTESAPVRKPQLAKD